MRLMTVLLLVLAVLAPGGEVHARRRAVRCCVMVPNAAGDGERPYCFVLNVRPARHAKKVCRVIGGQPYLAQDG
jgi:hypothetical protein